jgi:hypothetical protein
MHAHIHDAAYSAIYTCSACVRYIAEATDHGEPRWRRHHFESEIPLKEASARYKAEATGLGVSAVYGSHIKRRPPTTVSPLYKKATV